MGEGGGGGGWGGGRRECLPSVPVSTAVINKTTNKAQRPFTCISIALCNQTQLFFFPLSQTELSFLVSTDPKIYLRKKYQQMTNDHVISYYWSHITRSVKTHPNSEQTVNFKHACTDGVVGGGRFVPYSGFFAVQWKCHLTNPSQSFTGWNIWRAKAQPTRIQTKHAQEVSITY